MVVCFIFSSSKKSTLKNNYSQNENSWINENLTKNLNFINTIEPFLKFTYFCCDTKFDCNPVIFYNINNNDQHLINIEQNQSCFSVNFNSQKPSKMFYYNHIFNEPLQTKIKTLSLEMLHNAINCLVNNLISEFVILTINSEIFSDNKILTNYFGQQNEFAQLIHYGLKLHSIAWLFDAISNKLQTTIKISVNKLTNKKIFDLIKLNSEIEIDKESSNEKEYFCSNAIHATSLLNQALENFEILNNCNNNRDVDYVIVTTLHLHQCKTVDPADEEIKGKK